LCVSFFDSLEEALLQKLSNWDKQGFIPVAAPHSHR